MGFTLSQSETDNTEKHSIVALHCVVSSQKQAIQTCIALRKFPDSNCELNSKQSDVTSLERILHKTHIQPNDLCNIFVIKATSRLRNIRNFSALRIKQARKKGTAVINGYGHSST